VFRGGEPKVFFTSKGKVRIILLTVIGAIPIFIRPIVSFPLYVSIGVYLLIKNNGSIGVSGR